MPNVLKFSELLRAVPDLRKIVKGMFDFIAVEDVAGTIVASALGSAGSKQGQGEVGYLHHCSDNKVHPSEFRGCLEEKVGIPVEELEITSWLDKERQAGLEEIIYNYLKSAFRDSQQILLPVIYKAK